MFKLFGQAVKARFDEMSQHELFVVDAPEIWEFYLTSFPEGTNPIFRERTEHDCSCCKNFIRNLGSVVTIQDGEVSSVWDDLGILPHPYGQVANQLSGYVKNAPIKGLFRTKEPRYGQEHSRELLDGGEVRTWHHFEGIIARNHRTATPEAVRGQYSTNVDVFRRGLEEITAESLNIIDDLIGQNAIYRGQEFRSQVANFQILKIAYDSFDQQNTKDLFIWKECSKPAALFRNAVIGTLAQDLSNGVDLEKAVKAFESKVAPTNYKRPTAVITQRMIDDALTTLRDLGLENAVERRFARLPDVSVNNVLFVDNSVRGQMKDGLAGLLAEAVKPREVKIKQSEDIGVKEFFDTVVPKAETIDLLLENRHLGNFVSITAPVRQDVKPLFRWNNNFAWSYDGDVADSIKERVKRAGGNTEADLRVSLAWYNTDDLDIHCRDPKGRHIYYGNKYGILDVDMNVDSPVRDAVENMQWKKLGPKDSGTYQLFVHNFRHRESTDVGFMLEVECNGQIQQFTFNKEVKYDQSVKCLNIEVDNGKVTEIEILNNSLKSGSAPAEKWGLTTQQLTPVDVLMLSPNHWDGQSIGNRHWFFILHGCHNPGQPRGMYNEFLTPELEKHRKVFEVLGAKMKCPPSIEQLSGVGFSSTKRDSAKAVAKGPRINRTFNIQF